MNAAGSVDYKGTGRTPVVSGKPDFQIIPHRQIQFFRHIPVNADQFMRIQGDVSLVDAAVAAAFAACHPHVPLLLLLSNSNLNARVRNCIGIEKQRQPGNTPFILGKGESPRKAACFLYGGLFHGIHPAHRGKGRKGDVLHHTTARGKKQYSAV
jgi:hypothetical protein